MPVAKTFLIVFCLFSSLAVSCQPNISKKVSLSIKKIEKSSQRNIVSDTVLQKIQLTHDLVIGYVLFSDAWRHVPIRYFLIAFKKGEYMAYKYIYHTIGVNNSKSYELDSMSISKEQAEPIIKTFIKNQPWTLNYNEDSVSSFCPNHQVYTKCIINDAFYESVIVMTKTHLNSSTFYAPEYFENECCPGNEKRQRYLATVSPVVDFFNLNKTR